MQEDLGPLDVSQELVSQSFSVAGSFDQPWNVSDDQGPLGAQLSDPQIGHQRRKRVARDAGPGARDAADERRFAGVGQAHDPDLGDELELQPVAALLTGRALGRDARGLVGGGFKTRVAPSALSAMSEAYILIEY